jgi:hypothetical protein
MMQNNQERMEDHHERTMAKMDSRLAKMEECLEKTEATDVEASQEEIESEAEHEEVPKEEAAVEIFGALKERYGARHVAVGPRRQPKKRTHDNGGSRKKLAVARRRMTLRAGSVRHKGRCHNGPTVEHRRQTTETPGTQQWNKGPRLDGAATSEEGEDIRQDLQEDRRAGGREASSRVFHRTAGSEHQDIVEGSSLKK